MRIFRATNTAQSRVRDEAKPWSPVEVQEWACDVLVIEGTNAAFRVFTTAWADDANVAIVRAKETADALNLQENMKRPKPGPLNLDSLVGVLLRAREESPLAGETLVCLGNRHSQPILMFKDAALDKSQGAVFVMVLED